MLKQKLKLVPSKPGCYLMKDINDKIIYVGKAKKIKPRLRSYFNRAHTGKTQRMVAETTNFEYIITPSELEALLLELNLIKQYQPKYNILLKDDKTYPYIALTDEKYPRLIIIREKNIKDHKKVLLFGPYPNVVAARKVVNLLNKIYPLRKCRHFPKEYCLYFHINQCLGYCLNKDNDDKIKQIKAEIISFLKGNHHIITQRIEKEMAIASQKMMYERALELKEILEDIKVTLNKQIIDLKTNDNIDVFGHYWHNGILSIQVFFIRAGKVVGRINDLIETVDDKTEELLEYIITFYGKRKIMPTAIMTTSDINKELMEQALNIKVKQPKRGKYKQILTLASDNAKVNYHNQRFNVKDNHAELNEALQQLKIKLQIKQLNRIELFDSSHLFGHWYVGGLVVYTNGEPDQKEYRRYKITNPDTKDDINALREIIYRRYFKVLKDNLTKPDLIIVDGGKAQINAVRDVLDGFKLAIPVAGLVKDESHRTKELLGQDPIINMAINPRTPLFYLLNRMQEEVHRFVINYHRNKRLKGATISILDSIPGIGQKRKTLLLKKYGSLEKIKNATLEELTNILPTKVAENLYSTFNK